MSLERAWPAGSSIQYVHDDRHPTILIVEDDPNEEAIMTRSLRRSGCQVVVAHSTDEALEYLFGDTEIENPRVVITDLKVAPLGGADLISRIRSTEKTRLLPVVVLTGSASDEQIERLYRLGANSLLLKPLAYEDFSAAIEKIVRYWGMLNRSPVSAEKPARIMYTL